MKVEVKAYYGSIMLVSGAIIINRFPEKNHPMIEKIANIAKERLKGLVKDSDPQIRVEVFQEIKFTYVFGGELNSRLENLKASYLPETDLYTSIDDDMLTRLI